MSKKPTMQIEWLAPEDIFEYPRNVNQHPPEQVEAIADSIREFGITKPVLIDAQGVLIAGHGTRLGAIAAGLRRIPCIRHSGMSARQVAAYRLADNQLAKGSRYDFGMLADEIDALVQQDFDVSVLGFNEQELDALLRDDAGILPSGDINPPEQIQVKAHTRNVTAVIEDDFDEEPPKVPRCKPGQIWLLGRHRLMCGDSTDAVQVGRLLAGAKIDLVYADPPYGIPIMVDYGFGNRGECAVNGTTFDKVEGNDKEYNPKHLFLFGEKVCTWGANHYAHNLPHNGKWLIWDKRGDTIPERTQADCEMAWYSEYGAARMFRHYWDGMIKQSERGEKRTHPTQKPVALAAWVFEKLKAGTFIADPFGGSGTTLIACEQLDRTCYMMEIMPNYCDVIIARWEALTGETAVLEIKQ